MEQYVRVDREKFPLVVVTFTGAKPTPANFQEYLNELYANYSPMQRFTLVFDATLARVPGISYQKQQAAWMREHQSLIQSYCLGIAYVIPSAVIRNVLKLIFKIQRDPVVSKVFSNQEEGIAWAQSQLETGNHNISDEDRVNV
ncbi:MAG: STAS/SEC14 domain-containing protein [Tunicatimonas sp.]|uniref:STAS/SEC14 domain-containing protein n=1 Tax=Tunicatimonas sp. TaxID=1940096 RepID=UPI003C773B48